MTNNPLYITFSSKFVSRIAWIFSAAMRRSYNEEGLNVYGNIPPGAEAGVLRKNNSAGRETMIIFWYVFIDVGKMHETRFCSYSKTFRQSW